MTGHHLVSFLQLLQQADASATYLVLQKISPNADHSLVPTCCCCCCHSCSKVCYQESFSGKLSPSVLGGIRRQFLRDHRNEAPPELLPFFLSAFSHSLSLNGDRELRCGNRTTTLTTENSSSQPLCVFYWISMNRNTSTHSLISIRNSPLPESRDKISGNHENPSSELKKQPPDTTAPCF